MSVDPAAWAGVVPVAYTELTIVRLVTGEPPIVTVIPVANAEPKNSIASPPAVEPDEGETPSSTNGIGVSVKVRVGIGVIVAVSAPIAVFVGIGVAGGLSIYFVQTAHTNNNPQTVVAGLTVVDPFVAVALGIGLLQEAAGAPAWSFVVFAVAGAGAMWGVWLLAQAHADGEALTPVAVLATAADGAPHLEGDKDADAAPPGAAEGTLSAPTDRGQGSSRPDAS